MILTAIDQKRFKATILDITILNIDYIAKKQTKDLKVFLTTINTLFEVVGGSNITIAKESKCKVIITNDKKFYKNDLEVVSSRDFISKYL